MSITLKLCFIVFLIHLCQFVQCFLPRSKAICTKLDYSITTGSYISVKTCCNGYTQVRGLSRVLRCKPVCSSGCLHGICRSPENCQCFRGFAINPATSSCEPFCSAPCFNGVCVRPDTCECWSGFRPVNATHCEPMPCSPSCFNGDCVGPNECKCHDGYQLSGLARDGFDYTCLPQTTTSTSTTITRAVITSIDDDKVEYDWSSSSERRTSSSETTTEASSSYRPPDVKDQVFTDQDTSHRADDTETIISTTDYVTDDTTTETSITDESITVLFGGFTELDDDSRNAENKLIGKKYWIYIPVALILMAVVILLVAYRRRLLGYVKGRTYVVQGQQNKRASASSHAFNITYSSNGK